MLSVRVHEPCAHKSKDRRAVILVHGFAGNKTENGLFERLAQELAAAGVWSISYDWRGLGESGGRFSATGLNTHASDLGRIRKWASKHVGCPAASLAFVGFSLGAALILLAHSRGMTGSAYCFLSPAIRLDKEMWPRYRRIAEAARDRGPQPKPGCGTRLGWRLLQSFQQDFSTELDRLKSPLYVLHGSADSRIGIAGSRALFADNRDLSLRYEEVPGASHSFRPQQPHWSRVARSVVEWLPERI